jgi:hypothetical protein
LLSKKLVLFQELEAIKARVLAMEAESAKLKAMQFDVDAQVMYT